MNLCGICFMNKMEMALACGHMFCDSCITDWRKKQNTCPMCRFDHTTAAFFLVENNMQETITMRADSLKRLRLLMGDLLGEKPVSVTLDR